MENFQACGGVLQGSWKLQSQCPKPNEDVPCEFPFGNIDACQGELNTVRCHWDSDGRISFAEHAMRIQLQEAIIARYTFSEACTAAVRPEIGSSALRCTALSRPPLMSCFMKAELCVCNSRVVGEASDEEVPYEFSGNSLEFSGFRASFCVERNRLTLDFEPHPLSWKYWVLEKTSVKALGRIQYF